jgi:hypothetical protein
MTPALRHRALQRASKRGGEKLPIGLETRTHQELVEQGHLWQEIYDGRTYKFTLSASGRRMLDQFESPSAPPPTMCDDK